MRSRQMSRISSVSILLVIAASIGLVSAAMTNGQLPGFERFHGGIASQSPTMTYQGHLSVSFEGIYHYAIAKPLCRNVLPPCLDSDEVVFYLVTAHRPVRLVFYCGGLVKYYCSRPDELPFSDGAKIYVKGTLLEPSKWPTNQFEPTLHFIGDLYVFSYEIRSG